MDQVICNGELNYNKNKGLAGDYMHNYGNITFTRRTALDELLLKTGRTKDLPQYFVGKFNDAVVCLDHYSANEEIHDFKDMQLHEENTCFEGAMVSIYNSKWKKTTSFVRRIEGTFYKWRTGQGFFMVASQSDIDKLSEKEKNYLKIN